MTYSVSERWLYLPQRKWFQPQPFTFYSALLYFTFLVTCHKEYFFQSCLSITFSNIFLLVDA